jgi:hypothetical protein
LLASLLKIPLVSVEHNSQWHKLVFKALEACKDYLNPPMYLYCSGLENYLSVPAQYGPYGLIIVDGFSEWRNDCLRVAPSMLEPGGWLCVHDSQRNYDEPPDLAKVSESKDADWLLNADAGLAWWTKPRT